MLSRREKLLIRPWQQRRYIDHRKKVNSALPAIDVEPPATRSHVLCKSKKLQKESERCAEIAENNFILVRHLNDIMKTHRVDNHWIQEPPTFLNKVGIYKQPQESVCKSKAIVFEPKLRSRKEKCYACGPLRFVKKEMIPEERVPWDPDLQKTEFRKSLALSGHSNKLEVIRHDTDLPEFRGQTWSSLPEEAKRKKKEQNKTTVQNHKELPNRNVDFDTCSNHCIELIQGPLNLSVTFPIKTTVVYKVGKNKRVLHANECQCNAFHLISSND